MRTTAGNPLTALQAAHKRQYPNDSVASVIRFVPGTDLAKATKWLEEAKKRGIIVEHDTNEYHSFGGNEHPVWYIP